MQKVTGILLAGGKSRRMGTDKGFLLLQNMPLYTYSLAILEQFCSEIIISDNSERYNKLGYKVVSDVFQNQGPASGIYSALLAAQFQHCIVLTVDLPFITKSVISQIYTTAANSMAAAPVHPDGMVEPLCAFYHKDSFRFFYEALIAGNNKMLDILNRLHFTKVYLNHPTDQFNRRVFTNINTPEDLAIAQEVAKLQ